jgi:DNA (cytosine-5)-methyltransferase 1
MNKKDIVLLELFSGIGGFAKGFQDAGYDIKKHYFSEIDKHAIANYKYNFKNSEYVGSVTDVRGNSITKPDIITFGSPCQDFSLAGKRAGMEGSRSSLIMEAIRLISETKPSVFIWENVKGAFSSNDGADFWAIITAFTNIGGYRLEWQLCNTSWFLPQNRERIYLVGHLAGRSEPGVFPFTKSIGIHSERHEKKSSQLASTLNAGDSKSWVGNFIQKNKSKWKNGINPLSEFDEKYCKKLNQLENTKGNPQGSRIYATDGLSVTLSALGGGGGAKTGLYEVKSNTKKGFDIAKEGDSINLSNPNSETRRGRVGVGVGVAQTLDTQCNQAVVKPVLTPNRLEKRQNGRRIKEDGEDAFTLSCQDQHGVQINDSIRRLTEIECERLQGFPDDWTRFGIYEKQVWINKKEKTFEIVEHIKEIPKTQRYKMCGNAVTVDLPREIAKRLKLTNQI